MSGFFHKCPSRELKLRLDFRKGGLLPDETVVSVEEWLIYPSSQPDRGLNVVSPKLEGTTAQCRLLGGDPGQTYFATAHIRTDQGRFLKRTVVVRVSNNEELTR